MSYSSLGQFARPIAIPSYRPPVRSIAVPGLRPPPPRTSYGLGEVLTSSQVNRRMGWTPAKLRTYYNARAQACRGYADESACLARVARHMPVTISMGMAGLGQTTGGVRPEDVMAVAATTARLISNPEVTLRAQGPQIVAALDRHVVNPLVDRAAVASAPYIVRYLLPPIMLLYVISGVGAFFSYQSFQLQRGKLRGNRRRRRRR